MNFQGNKMVYENIITSELVSTLKDRKKHHVDYKKLSEPKKRELEHKWAIEFLKAKGIKFGGDK